MRGRVLVDGAATGAWNMAVDEVLAASAASEGRPVLRFYGWTPATLSLGYFQSHAARQGHPPSQAYPWVRRPSGGGAIVHDADLTYSLAMPTQGDRAGALALYRVVHAALAAALNRQRIAATVAGPSPPSDGGEAAFLCFQRRGTGDLLCAGEKVGGSAQRRLSGALLQHGSLLLATPPAAPELPGIVELAGHTPDVDALVGDVLRILEVELGCAWDRAMLTPQEAAAAERLRDARYAAESWNLRRYG